MQYVLAYCSVIRFPYAIEQMRVNRGVELSIGISQVPKKWAAAERKGEREEEGEKRGHMISYDDMFKYIYDRSRDRLALNDCTYVSAVEYAFFSWITGYT